MQSVTSELATALSLPRPAGLVVKDVFAKGPGEAAGIKRNDVIVALRDQPIDDEAAMRFRLATLSVGETVPIKVLRSGKEVTLQLPLAPNVTRDIAAFLLLTLSANAQQSASSSSSPATGQAPVSAALPIPASSRGQPEPLLARR